MKKYRIWIKSKPGMYEQYNGKVDVHAFFEEEAIKKAFLKLKFTFPDRPNSLWVTEKIEILP